MRVGGRLYPSYAPYPEAMRDASAAQAPRVPGSVGPVGAQEFLEELICAVALHGWDLGADVGDRPSWKHLLDGWGWVRLCARR